MINRINVYCDSMDIIPVLLKTLQQESHLFGNTAGISQIVNPETAQFVYHLYSSKVDMMFYEIHRGQSELLPAVVSAALDQAQGVADLYVTDRKNTNLLAIIEDTKTAPVGNSVVQRMDKVFAPLVKGTCPVFYIAPFEGKDTSQNTNRQNSQSWLYDALFSKLPENFIFVENSAQVDLRVLELLLDISSGVKYNVAPLDKEIIKNIIKAGSQQVRTFHARNMDYVFTGKLRKPSGQLAHPVFSTAILFARCLRELGKKQLIIETDTSTLDWLKKARRSKPNSKKSYLLDNSVVKGVRS